MNRLESITKTDTLVEFAQGAAQGACGVTSKHMILLKNPICFYLPLTGADFPGLDEAPFDPATPIVPARLLRAR